MYEEEIVCDGAVSAYGGCDGCANVCGGADYLSWWSGISATG